MSVCFFSALKMRSLPSHAVVFSGFSTLYLDFHLVLQNMTIPSSCSSPSASNGVQKAKYLSDLLFVSKVTDGKFMFACSGSAGDMDLSSKYSNIS
jgi:hypothetical protein